MNQILKNFISLGNTGNICYLQSILRDFNSKDDSIIVKRMQDLKNKKVSKIIILNSETTQEQSNSLIEIFKKNNIKLEIFSTNSETKDQIQFFESIIDAQIQGNISIVFNQISISVIELAIKLVLYINPTFPIEEVYSYFSDEELDIVFLNELKEYIYFLENDPYILTKPDRKDFNKSIPKAKSANGSKSSNVITEPIQATTTTNSPITLNLSSLKSSSIGDEVLLSETQSIKFNLNSLIESDFEKGESPEEHYEKLKNTSRTEVNESLSLDVDLSEEIEYISSLESLIPPSLDKISAVQIDTEPLEESILSTKIPNPTIDYTNKKYLDFNAIIDEEIEQEILAEEMGLTKSSQPKSFESELNLSDFTDDDNEKFTFDEEILAADSAINIDTIETKANIDLSFPAPLPDLDELMEEELDFESESAPEKENLVDPSQTFMVKRINDVIKKEVLNEDSKGKIPVSDLIKVDTSSTESVPSPTNPKVSNPKISNPKFNPISLDD